MHRLDDITVSRFKDYKERPVARGDDSHHWQELSKQDIHDTDESYIILLILALFIVIQAVVSTGGHSGYADPPKYGDYEAQRHWMELTIHLPISQWYMNSSVNDLNYWGLDYPPLTAYHSFVLGKISHQIDPSWVALTASRGTETSNHRAFMRLSVMITMLFLYAPVFYLAQKQFFNQSTSKYARAATLAATLLYPGLIYVDNGHFQYNHVALGLFVFSVALFIQRKYIIGSVLFVCALNFKQMELYHSLPIFVFLLSKSIVRNPEYSLQKKLIATFGHVFLLGIVVLGSFTLLWSPFMTEISVLKQVVHRIFPVARGIFEDKVANFWCCLDVIWKIRSLSQTVLLKASTSLVIASIIPTLYILFCRPNGKNLRLSLTITALSFFFFSFHVHEKTILMAAIPACFLLTDHYDAITMFLDASSFSMYALCIHDAIPEILIFFVSYHVAMRILSESKSKWLHLARSTQLAFSVAICGLQLFADRPERYPYLFELLNAIFSFGCFALFWTYLYFVQIRDHFFINLKKL